MNQPRSTNPALTGRPPGQPQQQQQPQQQPQQQQQQSQPGSAGLVGPNGQPIHQELLELRLNADGPAIPTPTMNAHELMPGLGTQVQYSMVITWVEIVRALSQRDAVIAFLERRLDDLEKAVGKPGISYENFMMEMQKLMEQQLAAQSAATLAPPPGTPPAGAPPR